MGGLLALLLRGALERKAVLPYIGSQLLGATLASAAVWAIAGSTFAPAPGAGHGALAVFLAEALVAFALALVIMNVATSKATAGNSYYGLAIGFTVLAGAYAVGGVSGGVFNPAVGFGPILVDALAGEGSFANLAYYIAGPVAGAVAAVPVFKMQNGADE